MSEQTTAPILKGSWSDAEKLALLVSLIKSTGAPPKWSNGIAVPEGRTLQACQKMYEGLLKTSASVKMTAGDAVTPSTKRARPNSSGNANRNNSGGAGAGGDGSPAKKRKVATPSKPKKTKKGGKPNLADAVEDEEKMEGSDAPEDEKTVVSKKVKKEEQDGQNEAV